MSQTGSFFTKLIFLVYFVSLSFGWEFSLPLSWSSSPQWRCSEGSQCLLGDRHPYFYRAWPSPVSIIGHEGNTGFIFWSSQNFPRIYIRGFIKAHHRHHRQHRDRMEGWRRRSSLSWCNGAPSIGGSQVFLWNPSQTQESIFMMSFQLNLKIRGITSATWAYSHLTR